MRGGGFHSPTFYGRSEVAGPAGENCRFTARPARTQLHDRACAESTPREAGDSAQASSVGSLPISGLQPCEQGSKSLRPPVHGPHPPTAPPARQEDVKT